MISISTINDENINACSLLFNQFIEIISDLGREYFTRIELDYLEETKLIDIGILALLLTLPSYNPLIYQHKISVSLNYLHILEPIIEKYLAFLQLNNNLADAKT